METKQQNIEFEIVKRTGREYTKNVLNKQRNYTRIIFFVQILIFLFQLILLIYLLNR